MISIINLTEAPITLGGVIYPPHPVPIQRTDRNHSHLVPGVAKMLVSDCGWPEGASIPGVAGSYHDFPDPIKNPRKLISSLYPDIIRMRMPALPAGPCAVIVSEQDAIWMSALFISARLGVAVFARCADGLRLVSALTGVDSTPDWDDGSVGEDCTLEGG